MEGINIREFIRSRKIVKQRITGNLYKVFQKVKTDMPNMDIDDALWIGYLLANPNIKSAYMKDEEINTDRYDERICWDAKKRR